MRSVFPMLSGSLAISVTGLIVVFLVLMSAPAAIPPAPIDAAFSTGDEKAVTDALISSEPFKRAIAESVKARDARKAELTQKPIGITPEQAARIRFLEVLQGK